MTDAPAVLRVVVDRRAGKSVVLVADDGRDFTVRARNLPPDCRSEGAVLDVPLHGHTVPAWSSATRNRIEEADRLKRAASILRELKKRDPGGDIEL